MATSQANNVKVEYHRMAGVPVNPAGPINPGDLVYFDNVGGSATYLAKQLTSAGPATQCIGVSDHQVPTASNLDITELQNTQFYITVIPLAIVEFVVDDNSTYRVGDFVTVGSTPQRITKTGASQGNAIGVVAAENKFTHVSSSFGGSVTATAATTKILIKLQPQGFLGRVQP